MPTYPLTYRISRFLERQIAWSRQVISELESFECTRADDLDALIPGQMEREKEAQDLAREYNGLSHEWERADDVSETDRQAIRTLSEEAQRLAAVVQEHYARAQRISEERAQAKQQALTNLRQRRRSVTIYRPEMIVSPGFVDKKA